MSNSKTRDWLEAHKDYPHKDWCLIWPFGRDPREGRAIMGGLKEGESRLAHRNMCEMVNGPAPPDKPQATHSCGNGHLGCVNPRHLDWGSNTDNQLQRYVHGRYSKNANGNKSQFTPEQIETMRSQYGEFTQEKLAEMYGVTIPTIQYYLKYRETRGHAGGKVKHWSPAEEDQLRDCVANGMSFPEIAGVIGRNTHTISMKAYRLGLKSGRPPAQRRNAFQ